MAQVAKFFHYFASTNKESQASSRVARLLSFQQEVKHLTESYTNSAQELTAWLSASLPQLEGRAAASTLEEARIALSDLAVFKNTERAEHLKKKTLLESNLSTLQLKLRSHSRAPFVPPAGLSLSEIDGQWRGSVEAEQGRDLFLRSQLSALGRLSALSLRFAAKCSSLEAWMGGKEQSLQSDDYGESLVAVAGQIRLLEALEEEMRGAEPRLAVIQSLAAALDEAASIRHHDIQTRFDALHGLCTARRTALNEVKARLETEDHQQQSFASQAAAFSQWLSDTADSLAGPVMGYSVREISAFVQSLDQDDADIKQRGEEQLAALEVLETAIGGSNRYTVLTHAVLQARFHSTVLTGLDGRHLLAAEELKRYQEAETLLASFGAICDQSTEAVMAIRTALLALTATENTNSVDDKLSALLALIARAEQESGTYGEAAAEAEAAYQAVGVTLLRTRTLATLRREWEKCQRALSNAQSTIEQEREMLERMSALQEELKARAVQEEAVVAVAKQMQLLTNILDHCDDVLGPVVVDTLEELAGVHDAFEQARTAYTAAQTEAAALTATLSQLRNAGMTARVESAEELLSRWVETGNLLEQHGQSLVAAHQQQEEVDTLRRNFAAAVTDILSKVSTLQAAISQGDKSLEEFLSALRAVETQKEVLRSTELSALSQLNSHMAQNGITENHYTTASFTDVQVTVDGLSDSIAALLASSQDELTAKSHGRATAEQIKEFRDCFMFFDSDKSNTLNAIELKACLASLGEDLTDTEMQTIMQSIHTNAQEQVEFDKFVEFMISRYQDKQTKAEIIESFRTLAGGRPTVSEDELQAALSEDDLAYLRSVSTFSETVPLNYEEFAEAAFADQI